MKQIEEQLQQLPPKPGVYLMKDELGEIIYVGKAKSLRNRVRSYFRKGNNNYKTRVMAEHIADFESIVTDTEVEAFILEANLIKKYNPLFNIRLKDDKSYPYIKITRNEDFPRIFKTRVVKNDGARYYGPFTDVNSIYKTINLLKDLFSLRSCKKKLLAGRPESRPCLNYHIGKCVGPCIAAIDSKAYHQLVDQVSLFLAGQHEQLLKRVEEEMYQAAQEKNFEKAARLRDSIRAFKSILTQQKVMSGKNIDQDVIALASDQEDNTCGQILMIRNGRLIGQDYYLIEGSKDETKAGIMESFLQQYYDQAIQLPDQILLENRIEQTELLEMWLKGKRGKKVEIIVPERGEKKRLVEMAGRNAQENLKKELIRQKYQDTRTNKAVIELGEYLNLDQKPEQIEGFDISNIQGSDPVASMVVFKGGLPSKQSYRRFKIKTVEGPNDFAMMQEVVERRYRRIIQEKGKLPDLILIDGGKGQLSAAFEILNSLGLTELPIIGLAKREEEIFLPEKSEPVIIPKNSPALHLLQRIRDEAHRFALSYHRKLRSRRLTHTMLDHIPGVGPIRRQALLQHFGSLGAIKKANISKLKEVEGISSKTARIIYDFLRENLRPY